ncbi:MAG: diadenylate cyclase CdaA [Christensenellaceae bacterium]|nr:diadenylate cyclase CdaA [Christensenellaceae bacterium]
MLDSLVKTISGGLAQTQITDYIDILIIAFLLYKLIVLTKETRAYQLLKGIGMLFIAAIVSGVAQLPTLSWLLNSLLSSGIIVGVVLFQPEIRRALEHIGRSDMFSKDMFGNLLAESHHLVSEMHQAISSLSRRRVGALIVIERRTGLGDFVNTGTRIEGRISAPLIENIFEPNTPLHDGAVVIRDGSIVAAACFLPLAEDLNVARELGTRHRAALGVSTVSDSITIVISEETGVVSMARDGKLIRYIDDRALRALLESIFVQERASGAFNLFKRRPKDEK